MQTANFLWSRRVLITCLLLLGAGGIYAVYAIASEPAGTPKSDQGVMEEVRDVSRAMGRLNQSYAIAPVVSYGSFVGGSHYLDLEDRNPRMVRRRPRSRGRRSPSSSGSSCRRRCGWMSTAITFRNGCKGT